MRRPAAAVILIILAVIGTPGEEESELRAKGRDRIASKMTPAQIAEAQKLAREWKPKKEK